MQCKDCNAWKNFKIDNLKLEFGECSVSHRFTHEEDFCKCKKSFKKKNIYGFPIFTGINYKKKISLREGFEPSR